jgi:aspartyl-tRNA(Asn)/glutamyl-tRNA(Gln) amidotransferase subunit A
MSLSELQSLLKRGKLSSLELTTHLLSRIAKADGFLHSFSEVYANQASILSKAADQARTSGLPLGPLHGLPVVLKDLLDIDGHISTLGSKHFLKRRASQTSATVDLLLQSGMVPLGKLHMTEFALGGWGTNPLMGTPHNPWDLKTHRVPGGSSSGTGVAVSAGFSPIGIGSDTGGSIRIPSAFNGLTGLKVTYGRISLHATGLLSWSLDSIGPMARNVRDCALILDALSGPDTRDQGTLGQPLENFSKEPRSVRGMRLVLPEVEQLPSFMHPAVIESWQNAAKVFESLGADVISVRLPDWFFDLAEQTGLIIASEAYSIHRDYVNDMTAPLGPAVRLRIQAAETFKPGEYAQAMRNMGERRQIFAKWFEPYDALLMPTVAIPAIPMTDVDETALTPGYLTRPINYLGLCALSLPAGFVNGLPIGLQIVGKPFQESTVLSLGQAFESSTDFHQHHPNLSFLGLD